MSAAGPGEPVRVEASGDRSIGAAGSIAVAVSGDNARVVTLPQEAVHWAREVQVPPGTGSLPGAASGLLVGREDDLARVHLMLASGAGAAGGVVVTQTGAIHGLGGVGKSTLALHYAHRFRARYGLVWWVTGSSPEAIVSGLAALAMRLCPQWAGTAAVDERAAWAITWLGWHTGWLLIFDNVEDPSHLHPYLGSLTGGHVLATSRRAVGWHRVGPAMPLGLLAPDAAADLLCRLAFDGRAATTAEREQADALARDLGFLPLALEQAGAYAYETGTPLEDYRRSLGLMLGETAGEIDSERTIARIWDHTLHAVEAREPVAVELLYAMAWLAPDDIPRTLLAALAPDPLTLGRALGALHAYNMISFTPDQGISVHRLVQTVLRARSTRLGPPPQGRHEAEEALGKALPPGQDARHTAQWERLIPHVLAVLDSTPPDHVTSSEAGDTFYACAQHLSRQGRDAQSLPLRDAILTQREQAFGDTHPETLSARHNLAVAYRDVGDLRRAIALFETTLAQQVQAQGDTHLHTLITRNQFAITYRVAGELDKAIPLFETTLAQQVQTLGDTHPTTLITRNQLAIAHRLAGDLEKAVPLFETTLAQEIQAQGETHPDTLITRANLAGAYRDAGQVARAIALFETTLVQQVQTLGDTHPDILTTRNNLAGAYGDAGEVDRAIALFETTLAQQVQVLGDTHPTTLITRANLASAFRQAGDLKRAIALFEATLAQEVRVLGETHPSTVITRANLAAARERAANARQGMTAGPPPLPPG
ncbi:FxSxx-COOH system tetratricopeptide repeat protein [Streptomyces sp. NBC_01198]|uniref:FxSxx-COOH system tetratricopeptide repeat protein n=1 Tax=Streptomyces sp. NBC_01198 TaxID=2903769 RepID=UPI002E1001C6|nr:FxSxx-COOH system tetratricopeptide repeat protein [Streptomyces sp. NBC_01198]